MLVFTHHWEIESLSFSQHDHILQKQKLSPVCYCDILSLHLCIHKFISIHPSIQKISTEPNIRNTKIENNVLALVVLRSCQGDR